MTDYGEIGRAILAAYDAGKEWPDEPIYTGSISDHEQIGVWRHGMRDGVGRCRVISSRYGERPGLWAEVPFGWDFMRDQPAEAVRLMVEQARFSFREREKELQG
jgi:hypothetical protein